MRAAKSLISYILFTVVIFFTATTFAEDVALVLMVGDGGISLSRTEKTYWQEFYETNYSNNHKVIFLFKEAAMLELSQVTFNAEIKAQLGPTDTITHLAFYTHGSSPKNKLLGPRHTSLQGIGEFGNNFISDKFQSHFVGLEGRFSKDLKIVLDACTTFCGLKFNIKKRAQNLLNYFGAVHGQIYGASTIMFSQAIDVKELSSAQIKYTKERLNEAIRYNTSKMATMITVSHATLVSLFHLSLGLPPESIVETLMNQSKYFFAVPYTLMYLAGHKLLGRRATDKLIDYVLERAPEYNENEEIERQTKKNKQIKGYVYQSNNKLIAVQDFNHILNEYYKTLHTDKNSCQKSLR